MRFVPTILAMVMGVPLPAGLVLVEERPIGPDSIYREYEDRSLPLRVFVTEVPLGRPDVGFLSVAGQEDLFGRERTSAIAARYDRAGHTVIAAINNDFGGPRSSPWGMFVRDGILQVSPINRSSLAMDPENNARIELFSTRIQLRPAATDSCPPLEVDQVNRWLRFEQGALYTSGWGRSEVHEEDVLEVVLVPEDPLLRPTGATRVVLESAGFGRGGTPIPGDRWILHLPRSADIDCVVPGSDWILTTSTVPEHGPWHMVSGGTPRLVSEGRPQVNEAETYNKGNFAQARHPRTAVGITEDRSRMLLVVVDGRQGGVSVGATLEELAELMASLGSWEALNMDGGGSSTMVVRGRIMNTPSDGEERETASSLLVVSTAQGGTPTHLLLDAPARRVAPHLPVPVRPVVLDEAGNEIEVADLGLSWQVPDGGTYRDGAVSLEPGLEGQVITVRSASLGLEGSVTLLAPPAEDASMRVIPNQPEPGVPFAMTIEVRDGEGSSLWVNDDALVFHPLETSSLERLAPNRFLASEVGIHPMVVEYGDGMIAGRVTVRAASVRPLDDPSTEGWKLRYASVRSEGTTATQVGEDSWRVDYEFLPSQTGAVYFETRRPIPPGTRRVLVPIEHNSTRGMVRGIVANDRDQLFVLNLEKSGDDPGIHAADLDSVVGHWGNPDAIPGGPYVLREVYLVEPRLDGSGLAGTGYVVVGTPMVEGFFDD